MASIHLKTILSKNENLMQPVEHQFRMRTKREARIQLRIDLMTTLISYKIQPAIFTSLKCKEVNLRI